MEERERRLLTQPTKRDARCIIKRRDTRSCSFPCTRLRSSTHKWALTLDKAQSECVLTCDVSADQISLCMRRSRVRPRECALQIRAPGAGFSYFAASLDVYTLIVAAGFRERLGES